MSTQAAQQSTGSRQYESRPEPSIGSSSREQEPPKAPDFKIFKPSSRSAPALPNLPDNYYTPTPADLRVVQAQLSARTQALKNAPLRLRAQREAEAKAKLDRWPETRIRIKFIDGTQVEKVFPSTNKIQSIYGFVRGCLREDVKPVKFILYQPPKHDLKASDPTIRDLTLAQLQLAPSSILLLRFEADSLNHATVPAPLVPSILAQAVDLPAPPPMDDDVVPTKTKSSSASQSTSSPNKVKIPKWMKKGK